MRAGDRATGKLADYLKRGVTTTDDINIANEIAATKTQLGERINWSTGRTKDQLAAAKRILFGGRLGVFFGYAFNSDLRAITSDIGKIDDDIPMGEKVAAMDRAIAGLKKEQNLEVAKGKNRTIGDMVRIAEAIDAAEFLQSRMGNYANLDQGKKSVESQNTGVRKLS
jgi:hypothetical protein